MPTKYLHTQHPNVAAELARRNLVNAKDMWFTALRNGHISLDQYRAGIAQIEQMSAQIEQEGKAV